MLAVVVALAVGGSARARAGEPVPSDREREGESAGPGGERTPTPRRAPGARVRAVLPAELPEDPTAAATVLEVEDFAGEAKSADEILGESVGLQVRRFGGPGNPSEISIRGSTGSQVVILQDGVRLNSAQSGTVDLSTIPVALVDRFEVVRGGGGIQAGSGAVGGVVNVVTLRPGPEPETRLQGSAGSFDTWTASAAHTRRTPWLDVVAGYDFFRTDGDWNFQRTLAFDSTGQLLPNQQPSELERINNESERHAGLVKLGRAFGGGAHRVELSENLLYLSRGVPGLDGPGVDGGQSATAHERLTRNVGDARLLLGELADGRGDVELLGFHRFQRQRFTDPMPRFGPPIDVDQRDHSAGGRVVGRALGALGPSDHALRLEVEGRRDWLRRKTDFDPRRWTLAGALQDEVALFQGRARVAPAVRVDWTEGFDTEVLPRLGVAVEPLSWIRLRGSVERAYRAPTFDELYFPNLGFIRGNPGLLPEEAWVGDVGLAVGFERVWLLEAVRFEATVFHHEIENSIVFAPINNVTVQAQNTGDATAQGVELAGGRALARGWVRLSGHNTGRGAEIETSGAPIPGRPRHEVDGRLALGPPSGILKLAGEVHHVSSIPLTRGGGQRVSARTTLDASVVANVAVLLPAVASAWVPDDVLVSLSGTNLTDQAVRDARGFPQPGRWITLALEGRW